VGRGDESLGRVELIVQMVLPLLKGESQALIVEELIIELIEGGTRNQDDLVAVNGTVAVIF
jgi:hypothetical protein